jgi:hypothetical protein
MTKPVEGKKEKGVGLTPSGPRCFCGGDLFGDLRQHGDIGNQIASHHRQTAPD